ncbi:MAG: DUF4381 domain-containing protein [Bdellovibrio bacteriovorus]
MSGASSSRAPLAPASDPLAGLRDWHLPEPVSWWPPAPGWWLVAGLSLILMAVAARWWRARRRRTAPLRAALSELAALRSGREGERDGRRFAAQISGLLRRLALVLYPREQVAGLTGPAWLAFLDRTGGGGAFTRGPGQGLTEAPYRPGPSDPPAGREPGRLGDLAERWIRAQSGRPR